VTSAKIGKYVHDTVVRVAGSRPVAMEEIMCIITLDIVELVAILNI
jgi:hypothetical protein